MKRVLGILATGVSCLWMIGLAWLISADLPILEFEEQQKLKADKNFWGWSSPYGSFEIHYVEKGSGTKHLLLLHGFRGHSYTWRHLMTPLAKAGYHVWAIDLIGYGLSDKPDNVPYNVDFFVQQVKDFMDAHEIQQAHFVGSSMGGGLALSVALADPQRIHSLTLLNALGYPIPLPLYLSVARYFSQIWAPFLSPTVVRTVLKQTVFNEKLISDEQVEAYALPYRFPGGLAATLLTLQQFDNSILRDMEKHYINLHYPLLVIWGDHDTLIPVSHYKKFLQDFPTAQSLLIKNCGHIPQEEEPEQVLTAMLDFLRSVDGR
jgi:pimeloyl-ACP methyl ester carboxylesterase